MTAGSVLRTLTLLEPLIELVEKWLSGDDSHEPTEAVRSLPSRLQSELAIERARRRPAPGG